MHGEMFDENVKYNQDEIDEQIIDKKEDPENDA